MTTTPNPESVALRDTLTQLEARLLQLLDDARNSPNEDDARIAELTAELIQAQAALAKAQQDDAQALKDKEELEATRAALKAAQADDANAAGLALEQQQIKATLAERETQLAESEKLKNYAYQSREKWRAEAIHQAKRLLISENRKDVRTPAEIDALLKSKGIVVTAGGSPKAERSVFGSRTERSVSLSRRARNYDAESERWLDALELFVRPMAEGMLVQGSSKGGNVPHPLGTLEQGNFRSVHQWAMGIAIKRYLTGEARHIERLMRYLPDILARAATGYSWPVGARFKVLEIPGLKFFPCGVQDTNLDGGLNTPLRHNELSLSSGGFAVIDLLLNQGAEHTGGFAATWSDFADNHSMRMIAHVATMTYGTPEQRGHWVKIGASDIEMPYSAVLEAYREAGVPFVHVEKYRSTLGHPEFGVYLRHWARWVQYSYPEDRAACERLAPVVRGKWKYLDTDFGRVMVYPHGPHPHDAHGDSTYLRELFQYMMMAHLLGAPIATAEALGALGRTMHATLMPQNVLELGRAPALLQNTVPGSIGGPAPEALKGQRFLVDRNGKQYSSAYKARSDVSPQIDLSRGPSFIFSHLTGNPAHKAELESLHAAYSTRRARNGEYDYYWRGNALSLQMYELPRQP